MIDEQTGQLKRISLKIIACDGMHLIFIDHNTELIAFIKDKTSFS